MDDEKFVDPFDAPPPEEVVSGRLETRDSWDKPEETWSEGWVQDDLIDKDLEPKKVVWKVWHVLRATDYEKLLRHAEKNDSTVSALLRGIVEDFVKSLD